MGFLHLVENLPQERLSIAVSAVAAARQAMRWTLEYTHERTAFGQPIAAFQNSRFVLAEIATEVEIAEVFLDRCIELHLKRELSAIDAAMLKLTTTELQGRVMDQCLQFFGGWGYMWEYPIARAFVDARLGRIGGGAVEVMKEIISRDMMPKNAKPARAQG